MEGLSMENMEKVVELAMNNGMSILITIYFLYRDWKYQGQLINLLTSVSTVLADLKNIVEVLRGYHINDK